MEAGKYGRRLSDLHRTAPNCLMKENWNPKSADAVFHMHEITKIYRMGDMEIHALRAE